MEAEEPGGLTSHVGGQVSAPRHALSLTVGRWPWSLHLSDQEIWTKMRFSPGSPLRAQWETLLSETQGLSPRQLS